MDGIEVWAVEQFGTVELGDKRRTQRAIDMAQAMARRPADGVAKQMGDWNGQRGAYRLLDNEAVSHEALSEAHWQQTRAKASESGSVVLMVQDITELEYSAHRATEGLGPIGDHRGAGLMVHNTLAIEPHERRVVGLAYQQVWTRDVESHKGKESRTERQARADRQSQRWIKAVEAIDTPPAGVRWVHVGDREIDIFPFFEECQTAQADFCVRVKQNRRVGEWSAEDPRYLLDQARQLPAMGERRLELPAKPGQAARTADLRVSWQKVTLRSPSNRPGEPTTLHAWVVRTWEPTPPKGVEPVEWLLLTSVPVLTLEDALEGVLVQIIAYRTHTNPNTMTLAFFWRSVAALGGFPGRKSDGQPGWKRLWHGWLRLLDWAEGVHFAHNLPPLQHVGNP